MAQLTEAELELLDFERKPWRYAGAKDQAIRDVFDTSPTIYYQRLLSVAARPEALAYAPTLVKRLRAGQSNVQPRMSSSQIAAARRLAH